MTQAPTIAVLDDEPEMRKALRRLLVTHGFRVELHARAEELLGSLAATTPDCILLDLHMPGITGFEVLEALAANRTATPVVVITGHDEPDTAERVRRLGVAAYLKKPVDEINLFTAIEETLSRARTLRSLGPPPEAEGKTRVATREQNPDPMI